MFICEHPHCFWRDNQGNPWHMDWTYCGPIFSRNNFEDGGVELKEVPQEIMLNAEKWAKSTRNETVYITTKPPRRMVTPGYGCKK